MINKIINHIWLQGNIPARYNKYYDEWSNLHPLWEHKIWDEKSLILLCSNQQIEEYKKQKTLINRVNFLKYVLMYNIGGIYVDIDSYPIRSLEYFFKENIIKDIDNECLLSIRYPFNTEIPFKCFDEYQIILPARKTLMFYPNGDKSVLLDNPILMSEPKNDFWLNLIDFCLKRKYLKQGFDNYVMTHEPFGPYGLTEFIYNNYNDPYNNGILILPPVYWCGIKTKYKVDYINHKSDGGW